MRETPYNFNAPLTPEKPVKSEQPTVAKKSYDESVVVDLSEELKRPEPKPQEPPKPPVEDKEQPKPPTEEPAPATSSVKVREGVEKLKEQIQKSLHENIADPKRASKSALRLLNTIRFFVYPWVYKKIIFEGEEANQLERILKKVAEIKMANGDVAAGLNNFEREVWGKYSEYETKKKGVLWTGEELDMINEVAYMKLAEIKVLRWLMENEWALTLIVIESKRFAPVIAYRMGFGSMDLSFL